MTIPSYKRHYQELSDLLNECENRHIGLAARGERLYVEAPKGVGHGEGLAVQVAADVRSLLVEHRLDDSVAISEVGVDRRGGDAGLAGYRTQCDGILVAFPFEDALGSGDDLMAKEAALAAAIRHAVS